MNTPSRIERDTMGEVLVPAEALYGAETQRAVENFPISRLMLIRLFQQALRCSGLPEWEKSSRTV